MSKKLAKILADQSFSTKELFVFEVKNNNEEVVETLYFTRPSVAEVVEAGKTAAAFPNVNEAVLTIISRAKDENGKLAFALTDINEMTDLPANLVGELYQFALNPSKLSVEEVKK